MNITAILTGKAKSSFKNKNIKKIKNKFIFLYPCIEAKKVKEINKFYTSSDSNIILNESKKLGYKGIKRPKHLSSPNSKHIDVILHALKNLKKNNIPEIVVILLANAPIVKAKWIRDCIKILKKNKKASAIVPVIQNNDNHPDRSKKIKKKFLMNFTSYKKNASSNRQDLEPCYFLCHNFWVIRTKEIYKNSGFPPWKFMGKKVLPYKIKYSIDIHNSLDLEIAKLIIGNEKFSKKYF